MPLTDRQIARLKPTEKKQKLADGGGLTLEVLPSGTRVWRQRYRWNHRARNVTLGRYPDVSLAEARALREKAKTLLRAGMDPAVEMRASTRADNQLETVARRWFETNRERWSPGHARTVIARLEKNVFPWLGRRGVDAVAAPELLDVLRRIEDRGAIETAHRVRQILGQVFDFAIAEGRRVDNPADALRKALKPVKSTHLAALTEPDDVAGLMRAIHAYRGTHVVRVALRLAPLVFVRPGELRHAEWHNFDLADALWTIPADKMKGGEPHLVPLSRQAVALLRDLHPLTGEGDYVFPHPRTPARPMSNNAVLAALRSMGYGPDEMTGHGFRAMARTMLDERLGYRPDYIEQQLAHVQRDPNGRAYNRTRHLAERREMMQAWADYLDQLRRSGQ